MIRFFKICKMLFLFKPFGLGQFKYFCIKLDSMSDEEWIDCERVIKTDATLRKFFKLN